MQAAMLRERVEIVRRTLVRGDYNAQTEGEQHVAHVWADITELTGNEAWKASQMVGQPTYRIAIRYLAGMLLTDKIVRADGTKLDITSMAADRKKSELTIMAKA